MSIHILLGPVVETEREKAKLDSLDKYQRRYLKNRYCGLCEKSLGYAGCLEIPWDADHRAGCDESVRLRRIDKCLAKYKPRPNRRKPRPLPAAGAAGHSLEADK